MLNTLHKDLLTLVYISSLNGYALSLTELSKLLGINPFTLENEIKILRKDFSLRDGLIVAKGYEHLFDEKVLRWKNSEFFLKNAKIFAKELIKRDSNLKFLALCGSTAYRSASKDDDIDIFLITDKGRLWLSLFKAFLLARVFELKAKVRGFKLSFCFSYVMDEREIKREFASRNSFFFARDALTLDILYGYDYYEKLILKNRATLTLLKRIKPKVHEINLKVKRKLKVNIFWDFFDLIIFAYLGSYVRFKAYLKNLRIKKKNYTLKSFQISTKEHKLLLESEKYNLLTKYYLKMGVLKDG
ncbi:MAG: hypothetical protein QXX95_00395 [Nitrososphaerales archaeon]